MVQLYPDRKFSKIKKMSHERHITLKKKENTLNEVERNIQNPLLRKPSEN